MDSYRELCTQFYDLDKPVAPLDALAFYLRHAEQAGGPILEPMCGSGRFVVPLLASGCDIDGVDASPQMLQACGKKCADRGLTATLSEQFIHELDLPRRYALAIIPAGSFGLLTDPDQARESLRRIRESLLPGGRFVLEIDLCEPNRTSGSSPWGGRWVDRPDGARILISWLSRYDADARVVHSQNKYELVKDGQLLGTEFEDFRLRLYTAHEFRSLLAEAGFVAIRCHDLYGNDAPGPYAQEAVFDSVTPD